MPGVIRFGGFNVDFVLSAKREPPVSGSAKTSGSAKFRSSFQSNEPDWKVTPVRVSCT